MFSKSSLLAVALAIISASEPVLGRERWLERDNRPVFLRFARRRFGQERPAVIDKLGAACPGQVCGTLAGQAITPLLAAQPECSQQDMADAIIDASKQFDQATQSNMVALAQEYRQAEKNTPPDFSTNPPALRNSVFCQQAPKNAELNGLIQAQDPANDPELFFDPQTKSTVKKGSQANTAPFGGAEAAPSSSKASDATAPATNNNSGASTAAVLVAATTGADFGACSTPQIEFGVGFENRKETSFQPTDKASFNHGSAQNIDIISKFICDTLTNSCKANDAAKTLCAQAITAADGQTPKTGAQADAFNGVFGISSNFASVASVDDQGRVVAGTTSSATPSAGVSTSNNAAGADAAAADGAAASGGADFGSCSTPQIEFGVGFDNRKETSFEPVDKASFNHGSAQNIDIITQFICDSLTNTCKANDAAKSLCAQAITAAGGETPKTGAQADAFNAVFGVNTNFASVAAIDNQGNEVAGSAAAGAAAASNAGASDSNAASNDTGSNSSAAATNNAAGASNNAGAASGAANFGTCSTPQIEFGVGFDNRKETSFQPTDKTSFNHGSAQNIDIISRSICDTLTNSCKANDAAKALCAQAITAADGKPPKTGAQADAFNAVFGASTNFASVQAIDDQGRPVA